MVRYSTSLRRRVSLEMCVNACGWRRSQEDRLSSCRPGHVSEMTSTHASFKKWQQDSSRQTRLSPQAFRKLGGRNQRFLLHHWSCWNKVKEKCMFSIVIQGQHLTVWPAEAGQGESPVVPGPGQVEPLEEGTAALQVSQGGIIQPGPVRLQAQLGVLQRVTAVLVQQLAALGQTAEVWQGQMAQYQLDELWMEDGERG